MRPHGIPQTKTDRRGAPRRLGRLTLRGGGLTDVDLRGLELGAIGGVDSLRGATISSGQLIEFAPLLATHLGLQVRD